MIEGFTLTCDSERFDVDAVHALLRHTHWGQNRGRDTVATSLRHSLNFGIFRGQRLAAFARVVTDHSTFAYLCDVVVDPDYRGQGLSKWLMKEIMATPSLKVLRRFVLATRDAHSLYRRHGFESLTVEESRRFMSILRDDV